MGIRARACVFGFVVLAATAGGYSGPTGSAHRGQTGEYVELRDAPARVMPSAVPRVVIIPRLFLSPNGPKGYPRGAYPHTPIVVTENPADEEFWEIAYPMPAANTEGDRTGPPSAPGPYGV